MRDCGFLKCKSSIAQSVIYIFLTPLRLSLLHLLMPLMLPCDLTLNLHLNHWLKLHAPSAVLENLTVRPCLPSLPSLPRSPPRAVHQRKEAISVQLLPPRLLAPIERREGPPSRPRPTRDADCSSLANSVAKASSVLSAPSHCSSAGSRSTGRLAKLQCLSPFPLSPS